MNAFANTLFSLLFSWVKGLVQSVWGMVSGGAGGFFIWLGDHWLGLVAVICLLGVLCDVVVWLLRWRPDLVWRTQMRRLRAHMTGQATWENNEKQFYQGYEEAVDLPPDMDDVQEDLWQNAQEAPAQDEMMWWDVPQSQQVYEEAAPQEVQPRRRRSDKYQKTDRLKRLSRIKDKWQEDENTMLDELPTSVDSKDAFYDPVFPVQENKPR